MLSVVWHVSLHSLVSQCSGMIQGASMVACFPREGAGLFTSVLQRDAVVGISVTAQTAAGQWGSSKSLFAVVVHFVACLRVRWFQHG